MKLGQTAAWALFAACILATPVLALAGWLSVALVLDLIVLGEVMVLAANGWRCPLTDVARRYTDDRADNFDIYLPLWLARHNKVIFGWLFVAGMCFAFARWQRWMG